MNDSESFFLGLAVATTIFLIIGILILIRPNTQISQEIMRTVERSTNIVEALKNENLVIKEVCSGSKDDTVEIVVEYDFLYKNSKIK